MFFHWNEKRIEWYDRAVRYTGFDEFLFHLIEPYIKKEDSLCDLGCGIGCLSRILGKKGFSVTAVDRDETAVAYLKACCERENLSRVTPLVSDWENLPPDQIWDTGLLCFAGRMQLESVPACRRLIVLANESRQSHIRPDGLPAYYYEDNRSSCEKIPSDRYSFQYRHTSAEFGQPFLSREEALDYLNDYGFRVTGEEADARLTRTGRKDYPLYLPHTKEIGMYVIDRKSR